MTRAFFALLVAVLVVTILPARAADIRLERGRDGAEATPLAFLWLSGPIAPGDTERVNSLLSAARREGRPFLTVYLDSPGGDLLEGLRLGQSLRDADAITVLLTGSTCASACILAFAGGTGRMAYRGARLGVHGASSSGRETTDAMAGTLAMARLASKLGVPDSIVTKIITTPPDRLTWLTRGEIAALTGPGMIDREEHGRYARSSGFDPMEFESFKRRGQSEGTASARP